MLRLQLLELLLQLLNKKELKLKPQVVLLALLVISLSQPKMTPWATVPGLKITTI